MGRSLESTSPIDGATLGAVPATDPEDVAAVVAAVAQVQPLWAQLRLGDRARYLRRAAQAVIDEWDELLEVLVREQGRPRAEAQAMELVPGLETVQWLAEAGPRILGEERIGLSRLIFPRKRARLHFEPLGVVGVITPAAEPWATPLGDVAVALMGGNRVVLAPSPPPPGAAQRIGPGFPPAGLPAGP